jgi:hypothetical protein
MKNNNVSKRNQAKQRKWDTFLKKIDITTDNLGMPIDENIKQAIVAMNLLGLRTAGSCQGHVDEYILFPYIYCEVKGEPKLKYDGERSIRIKIIKKYNIKNWNIVYTNDEIWNDYWTQVKSLENSNKYKKWAKKNESLGKKISLLINKFNKKRNPTNNNKLQVIRMYPGYRIVALDVKKENLFSKKEKIKLIKLSQKEFADFTIFLKKEFFNN